MRAFQMTGVGSGCVVDLPDPEPGRGELLLRPIVSGVCSTDVHVYLEAVAEPALPVVLGHESVAEVIGVGQGTGWNAYGESVPREGDRVVVEPLFPCRTCTSCVRGLPNVCLNSRHMGITRDGCFAEMFTAPAWRTTKVPDGLRVEEAIFIEPFACALHFVTLSGLGAGQHLLVLGGGPAGLLTVLAGTLAGLTVALSEPEPARRALGGVMGAQAVASPDHLQDVLAEAGWRSGPDAIIEVTGVSSAVAQALDIAPPAATVVLTGIGLDARLAANTVDVVLRELTVRGAVASRGQFARSLELIANGLAPLGGLVTHRLAWTQADEALRTVQSDRTIGKVLLDHPAG
ncbi:MAG: alcohol dehydrogenase catalytic domain-containing protein [bacterium]|nr:alcohol dehydrogenase catalytic domain-containing protein [bacterium]